MPSPRNWRPRLPFTRFINHKFATDRLLISKVKTMNSHKQLRTLILGVVSLLTLWTSLASADQPATTAPAAATTAAAPTAAARASFGAVTGIVRNSAKLPVAGATVTAMRTDASGVRATVSGS